MSLSALLGRLSQRSPSRDRERDDKDEPRGRSRSRRRDSPGSRTNSVSPTALFRARTRSPSVGPAPEPLQNDSDSDSSSDPGVGGGGGVSLHIDDVDEDRGSFSDDDSSSEWSSDSFGPETDQNTELNAQSPAPVPLDPELDFDPLGEGINVVYPKPEPFFASDLKRRTSRREGLVLHTGRPTFQRDCCTIAVTHGDPAKILKLSGRQPKTYLVGSDMSDEARFALDWAIGMVLRDGDELVVATILETESKLDTLSSGDHLAKLRNQQERETHAFLIARQVNSILQRTRLQVTVLCQAWHAKNMRHMMLDLVDLIDPVMLIVGSRGIGKLKGILLGSTAHYLVHRSSVPVMVARRRLKRPARRQAHLQPRHHVSLAEATIDKEATGKAEDPSAIRAEVDAEEQAELRKHHEE